MPQYTYDVPGTLEDVWGTSMTYWQHAYSCEVSETKDIAGGGRFMLVKKKFDISGVFGFKIELRFTPSPAGVQVTIKSEARAAQLSQFGRLVKDWCKAIGIDDQGVLGKSIGDSFKGICICCAVLVVVILIVLVAR